LAELYILPHPPSLPHLGHHLNRKKVALVPLKKLRKREVKKILAERGFSPEKRGLLPEING
jgi:hypothetical protein